MSTDRFPVRARRAGTSSPSYVRASELGEFAYCRRSWWLRHVVGRRPDPRSRARLAQGHGAHARHAREVARGGRDRLVGWALVVTALLLLLLAAVAG